METVTIHKVRHLPSYTTYELRVRMDGDRWKTTKRYSQFAELHRAIHQHRSDSTAVQLAHAWFPAKRVAASGVMGKLMPETRKKIAQERRTAFTNWLNHILKDPAVLSLDAVQSFLHDDREAY